MVRIFGREHSVHNQHWRRKSYRFGSDPFASLNDGSVDTRLAIYGTSAPGRINRHPIWALAGKWQRGSLKDKLFSSGWGAALGFPSLLWIRSVLWLKLDLSSQQIFQNMGGSA